ncbi:MAG: PKD domain-containing protein [Candidatus Thermoplasmatota archaeon]|nr:PKD domain-containing protein [Candidatus Thermoplasmatota archaeon]
MKTKACSLLITFILLLAPWITVLPADSITPPQADTGGPYNGTVGIPIQFDGSESFSPNKTIVSYEWYCGDGRVETGITPTHTYSHPGTYTLTLTVKDEDNNCGTDTTQVTVTNDLAPTASFIKPAQNTIYFRNNSIGPTNSSSILIGSNKIIVEADDDIGVKEARFYIDDQLKHIDDQEPYEWTWRTGHFTHELKATVVDSSGQETSIKQTVFKWRLHPLLILSVTSLLLNNQNEKEEAFTNLFERNNNQAIVFSLLKLILQQNNEESQNLFSLLKQMISTDKESTNLTVFLNNHPLIKTSVEKNYPLIYRLIMLSDKTNNEESSSSGLLFNDNTILKTILLALLSSKLSSDTSLFQPDNNQLVEGGSFAKWLRDHPLIAITSALLLMNLIQRIRNRQIGKSDETDTIENKNPVARTGGPYTSSVGKTVVLSAENSYDDDGYITSFSWELGDETQATGETVTHTYDEIGEYTIILTVTDNDGATANDTTSITISEYTEESAAEDESGNTEFLIISGFLSAILAIGLAVLQFRRRLFE